MCNPDEGLKSGARSGETWKRSQKAAFGEANNGRLLSSKVIEKNKNIAESRNIFSSRVVQFGLGAACGLATLAFSLWFPFAMAPHAANETYKDAAYTYNAELSFFDNSPWTYGTDYGLVIVMAVLSCSLGRVHTSDATTRLLCLASASLLGLYAMSVMAGGFAHQFYTDLESRNTWHFRLVWTICVGTVSLAGGVMGVCGTQLAKGFHLVPNMVHLPIIPSSFWVGFGIFQFVVCAIGGISYQRPACDIFIAGTTQFPSTCYVICVIWLKLFEEETSKLYRVFCYIGFLWNAPLLPMYPLLVQYTDWSLASVNTLLHGWLLVGWSLQGTSLEHFCDVIAKHEQQKTSKKE